MLLFYTNKTNEFQMKFLQILLNIYIISTRNVPKFHSSFLKILSQVALISNILFEIRL